MKYFEGAKNSDIIALFAFTVIFIILSILTWGVMGDPFVDCGREAYLPASMLKGNILIKDIFILYNPLSYQINAVLYKLFSSNLTTLYVVGIISAYLILLISYLITRMLFKPLQAFSVVFIIVGLGVFKSGVFNYIFPYSYSIVYALIGLLLSVLFGIYAIKNCDTNKFNLFIYLSCFSLGFSIANKFEYFYIIVPILFIPIVFRKFRFKEYFYSFTAFTILPVISYGILFIQGLSFQELVDYIHFGTKFFSSPCLLNQYQKIFIFTPFKYTSLCLSNFLIFVSVLLLDYGLLYLFLKSKSKIIKCFLIIFFPYLNFWLLDHVCMEFIFCWFVPLSLIVLFSYYWINRKSIDLLNNQEFLIAAFILSCGVLSIARTYFVVNLYVYGTYLLPLLSISLLIVFLKFIPDIFAIKDKSVLEITISLFFIMLSLTVLNNSLNYKNSTRVPVNSEKGAFLSTAGQSYVINESLQYLYRQAPENSTCLVLPEGALINFMADRKSMDKYYHLLPNHIDAIGEDNIVKDLKNKPPEFIFITDRDSSEYGAKYFCKDYAYKICKFIDTNYKFQKRLHIDDSREWEKFSIIHEIKIYKWIGN